jgi:hypothetical protein
MTQPCQNEKENFEMAVAAAISAIGAGAAAAPETLGASIVAGLFVGAGAGVAMAITHEQYARCLREHGLTAEADILDQAYASLNNEISQLTSSVPQTATA